MIRRCAVITLAIALAGSAARAEPETGELVAAGLAMAPPTFFIGTFLHEGSHALTAWTAGAEVTTFHPWPGWHPASDVFYFGWVDYSGRMTRAERALFLIAPKLTNVILFAGYTALVATETLPENDYAELALAVFATGLWVDFTKDVFAFRPQNDIVRVYSLAGLDSEWSRLPLRLAHAGLSVAAGFVLWHAYDRVFERDTAGEVIVPLTIGAF